MVVGDLNGDGIPDLAVVNGRDHTVSILLGNGDGAFATKSTVSVAFPHEMVVADFNGDGILDLATHGVVLLGNGDGTFATKLAPQIGPVWWRGTSTATG